MNYTDFLKMIPEAVLVAILIITFIADFATAKKTEVRKWMNPLVSIMFCVLTVVCLLPLPAVHAFGDMYITSSSVNVIKAILALGSLIVVIQSRVWAEKSQKEGEFYMLLTSTLLGMFVMVSAGNFLMFFLGLEMASVPLRVLRVQLSSSSLQHSQAVLCSMASASFMVLAELSISTTYAISF